MVIMVSTWTHTQNGEQAASLAVAEQYVQAFSKLAQKGNTILLPEKTGDVGSMVAQVSHTPDHTPNSQSSLYFCRLWEYLVT